MDEGDWVCLQIHSIVSSIIFDDVASQRSDS